jgi:hypothetical protein
MSVFYNQHSELYKYRQLCDLADIITLAVLYSRQSELDKYRQLSGMADILITLVVFYSKNSLSISSAVWYGRHINYSGCLL